MRAALPRLTTLMRTLALALLFVGMAVNPVLAFVGDFHALDHAAPDGDADGHAHADDHAHTQPPVADSGSPGEEQGDGWHGLMHLSHGCAASTMADGTQILAAVPQTQQVDAPPTASLAPLKRVSVPFRPPII